MQLNELKKLAQKAAPQSQSFFKKNKKKLEKMDSIVLDLHQRIMSKTNCLLCANCCKTLGPMLHNKDIENIAKALQLKPKQVVEKYLKTDEDGDLVFNTMPCPFLMPDNYCSIYNNRPKACREYPHTDRSKFYQIFELSIKNTYTCPVAYEVIEELKKKITD